MTALVRVARASRADDVNEALRFAGLALSVNSAMAAIKIVVGILSGSHAILASSLYSINDVLSAIAVAVSLKLGHRRACAEFPYGRGKAEFVAVGLVSVTIGLGVFFMFFFSVIDIIRGVDTPPHFTALSLAGVSMVVSWLLARKGHHVAAKLESPAVNTSADHHHADAEGSLAAIIGVGGAMLGFHVLDRVIAVFETLHIVALSGTLLARSIKGLMDTAVPPEDLELVERACTRIAGVERVAKIRSRRAGSTTWVDVAVAVDTSQSVREAHTVTQLVRSSIRDVLGPGATVQVRFQGPAAAIIEPGPGGSEHG